MFKNLQPLRPYLWKYRRTLVWGVVSVMLTNGIGALFPQVVRRAVDALNGGVTREKIITYSLMLVVIGLSKGIFQFLTRWLMIGVSRDIEYELRNDLFAHLEALSYPYYQRNRTGDIMARATNDLNAVRMLLEPAIMYTPNTFVFTLLVLWLGPREVLLDHMSAGEFVGFMTYIVMLTWPVIAVGWVINIFQRGMASMGRINEILTAKPDITDAQASPALANIPIRGELEFRDLNFSYNGVRVLKNIALRIPAGSSLAIVGPTGSGKTTLVNLLPRIYDAPDA